MRALDRIQKQRMGNAAGVYYYHEGRTIRVSWLAVLGFSWNFTVAESRIKDVVKREFLSGSS